MGLLDWRHAKNESPLGKAIVGGFIVLLWLFFFYIYLRNLIKDFNWIFLILFGLLLLFLFPFMVFGGINEIVEAIDYYKKKDEK